MSHTLKTMTLAAMLACWPICGAFTPVSSTAVAPATQPAAARRLMIEAAALEAGGNTLEAGRRYARVIDLCRGTGDVALVARGRLAPLLLDAVPFNASRVQEQLDAMRVSASPVNPNLWDWQCRLAFREIVATPAGQRERVWKECLPLLRRERASLTSAGLRDLDRLLSATGDAPLGDRILVDLVLLFPDAETLAQLQLARARRFAQRQAWDDARAAADGAALAASLPSRGSGPLPVVKAAAQLFAVPGAPADGATSPARWSGDGARTMVVDSLLLKAAQSSLTEGGTEIGPRRRPLLSALAGNAEGAARSARDGLREGFASPDTADEALSHFTLALALADGSFVDPFRFARSLAGPGSERPATAPRSATAPSDPALAAFGARDGARAPHDSPSGATSYAARGALVRAWLGERERMLVQWGAQAVASGEPAWARVLFAAAANVRPEGRGDSDVLQRIYIAAGADRSPDQAEPALDLLGELVPLLRSGTDRRDVRTRIASVRLEQGKFQAAIDEVSRAGPHPETMTAGFTLALSLLRLDRADEAVARLVETDNLPGTDEEHARAMFLIGWIRLRDNDRPRAAAALERVVDRYPRTTAARKALDLLPAVQGGS